MSEEIENGGRNPARLARAKKNSSETPAQKPRTGTRVASPTLIINWLTEDEIPELPIEVSERVEYIADIMSDLRWKRGKSGKLISKVWGLSLSTIEHYASEASRLVIGNREVAQRDITAGAIKLFTSAVQSGDAKGAKMMGDLLAAVSGANAPQKQELEVTATATPGRAKDIMAEAFTVAITEKKERHSVKDIDYYGDDPEPDPDSESDT